VACQQTVKFGNLRDHKRGMSWHNNALAHKKANELLCHFLFIICAIVLNGETVQFPLKRLLPPVINLWNAMYHKLICGA